MFEPDQVLFITSRCFQSRLFMLPSHRATQLIGGILARAVRIYNVELFGFVFLSNHFHLLIRGNPEHIPDFVGYLKCNLAKEIGRMIGWRGSFWERRYDAAPVLDDTSLVDRLRYILSHGVKENLVAAPSDWPGLTAIPELSEGKERRFPWINRTKLFNLGRQHKAISEEEATIQEPLRMACLPCWENHTRETCRQLVQDLILKIEKEARIKRETEGIAFLGKESIFQQDPLAQPVTTKRSPRVLCHTATQIGRKVFRAIYHAFCAAYRKASAKFRAGIKDVIFPEHCFPPRLPYGWLTG